MHTSKLPKGFLASGIHCGAKMKRKDLSLFYSEVPCAAAALFTNNVVKAAPVVLGQEQIKKGGKVRAVLVNSGNANCMTGKQGLRDAGTMMAEMAKVLGVNKDEVFVSSTGIIGEFMSMKPILKGMKTVAKNLSSDGMNDAADGIMTTDKFRKISTRIFKVGGKKVKIMGVAKGAGMIKPEMATMLSYIMTDAAISKAALKKALAAANEVSYNAITVDGDMSTNDTVLVMANGVSDNKTIALKGKDFDLFSANLKDIMVELAKMIVKDGEGAHKLLEVTVTGAKNKKDAKRVADSIGGSLLVKCAVLGGDPNWGRIASSAGAAGVKFDTEKIKIKLDGKTFFANGKSKAHVNRKRSSIFKGKEVTVEVDLAMGKSEAKVYSCDISKKYIAFNSYYTT